MENSHYWPEVEQSNSFIFLDKKSVDAEFRGVYYSHLLKTRHSKTANNQCLKSAKLLRTDDESGAYSSTG